MEKKLTDEEIVKALEICASNVDGNCEECPYHLKKVACWKGGSDEYALDLINRQKAEIERLNKAETELQDLNVEYYNDAKDLRREVDELKEQVLIAKLQGLTEGYLDGVQAERNAQIIKPSVVELPKEITDKIREKVEKDTAKEILAMFDDRNYITERDLKEAIAERYGVEVE